jgi:hypothetical protein
MMVFVVAVALVVFVVPFEALTTIAKKFRVRVLRVLPQLT